MTTAICSSRLDATHHTVASMPDETFGYFAWPSIARMGNGTLAVAASGMRNAHNCPYGRNILCLSHDNGKTWTSPRVINDTPLDDRDAGLISLGGNRLLMSWFTCDAREKTDPDAPEFSVPAFAPNPLWTAARRWVTDQMVEQYLGSWLRCSNDGGITWGEPRKVPVTAPHGPIQLQNGNLLYLGKQFGRTMEDFCGSDTEIQAIELTPDGDVIEELGIVPICPDTFRPCYHEPHAVQLPSGRLIGHIRLQNFYACVIEDKFTHFSLVQTESDDGGRTWTQAHPLGFHGSPPHLLLHSSGALICTYGYRIKPYGIRVAVSWDEGETWQPDMILRDDGPIRDLGYPATVELANGDLYTVYYQQIASTNEKHSLLGSTWQLPDK